MIEKIVDTKVNGIIIDVKHAEMVCSGCCDDTCEAVITENYYVNTGEAWEIIDELWNIYGRS